MSKHTPGPWEKVDGTDGITRGIRGWHGPESVNVINWNGISRATSVTGQANARLLLAAPDLLEALQQYGIGFSDEAAARAEFGNYEVDRELKRRAAIAKATGEQP